MIPADVPPKIWMPEKPALVRAAELPTIGQVRQWKREHAKRSTFPIPFYVPAGAPAPSFSYIGQNTGTVDGTSHTFAGSGLGTAHPTRLIVYALAIRSNAAAPSVTLDGNAMSSAVGIFNSGSQSHCSIWYLAYPTGTTGQFVVSASSNIVRMSAGIYALYNLAGGTPVATNNSTAANPSLNLNTAINTILVAVASQAATGAASWTGLTDNSNLSVESLTRMTNGSHQATSAETPRTLTCTFTGSTNPVGVSASFL